MKKTFTNIGKVLLLPALVYCIFLIIIFDRFSKPSCLYTIFLQSIIPTITAYGVAFGFISGIFDFTIGARIVISGIVGGLLATNYGIPGLLAGCLLASLAAAAFTGILNWACRIPSLIVTLGLTMILEIVGKNMAGRFSFILLDNSNTILGSAPYIIFILIACLLLYHFIDRRTTFSYELKAVGSNEAIAKSAGIHTQYVKFMTFIVGAVFVAIAAMLTISQSGSMGAQINLGSVMLVFKPLMSIIIALALQRACPLAVGIFIGQFTLNTIFVGLIAAGLPDTFQNVALGFFLLVVIIFSNNLAAFRGLIKKPQKMNS
jgi:Ribose/xylose/arabinose/galactoside ABC-type transport systems, permease components